jgi:glycosyltransferase involved in cell wall biosynthesis
MVNQFNGLDIFHGLSHELPLGIQKAKVKSIVTIHDLIYHFYPHDFPWIDRQVYDYKFRYACRHADRIIAISESTKQDIQRIFNIPGDKISVIYQPLSPVYDQTYSETQILKIRTQYKLPPNYNLYVGSTLPRKNLLNVLKAHVSIDNSERLPLVVLTGGNPKRLERIKKKYSDISDIFFFGQIDPTLLPVFYNQAALTLYPSKYEGFGLPIVESLKMGTPVITSNRSSLPEAAGDGAIYVDPNSPGDIAQAIISLNNDESLRNQLVIAGSAHIEQFNSKTYIRKLNEVYTNLTKK